MFNSIESSKRHSKASLNMFFIKKIWRIHFFIYDRRFESNRNFTTKHVKNVIIPGFSSDFCSKFRNFLVVFSKYKKFQVFLAFFS